MSEEFALKVRTLVLEYYPNCLGHKIEINLPSGTRVGHELKDVSNDPQLV